jgi:hypothetical protein
MLPIVTGVISPGEGPGEACAVLTSDGAFACGTLQYCNYDRFSYSTVNVQNIGGF